jgi:hypothetical protein
LNFTDAFTASLQSPNSSFNIAAADVIGPPKADCQQVPIIWNLIEAKIKRIG